MTNVVIFLLQLSEKSGKIAENSKNNEEQKHKSSDKKR
jgi:hypothetical protein